MPDHKRADHPERSKLISTFCLGKMLFLSHSKKQVRFDFTTKILHVTQVFGEIHVSRTFILYMVSLRLSFLFCCRISLHHHRSTSETSTSATAQQLNETIEGCRFNTGVCVRDLSPHPAADTFIMGAHVLLKVHNTKKCCQEKLITDISEANRYHL